MVISNPNARLWACVAASVWLEVFSANTHTFPLYSRSLKCGMGLSPKKITLLGVANDFGTHLGFLAGVFSNRCKPWVMISVGAAFSMLGYGLVWLSVSQTVQIDYMVIMLAVLIASNSGTWLTTAVLVTNINNFPLSRGNVVALMKGYGALGSTILLQIFSLIFHNDPSMFLLFLIIAIPCVCFCGVGLVRVYTPATDEDDSETKSHFLYIQMSYTVLGVYLCVIKVFHHFFPLRAPVSYIVVVMILILLMAPAGVVAKMWWNTSSRIVLINEQEMEDDIVPVSLSHNALNSAAEIERQHRVQEDVSMSNNSRSEIEREHKEQEDHVSLSNNPRNPILGDEFNFIDAIINADFWLLILVYFVGVGSGAAVINNLAQIGISQGVEDTTTLVSLFSLCNSVGRVSGGLVSEHFIRTMYIPRTVWMTCTQTMMIVIYTLLAFSVQRFLLYVSVAFLGICYGMHVSIMISTVSELFGLKNLGLFSHIMMLGNPIGSIILSLLQGSTYDKEAAKQLGLNMVSSTASCVGVKCFKQLFLILSGVCAAGVIFCSILTFRIRHLYQKRNGV